MSIGVPLPSVETYGQPFPTVENRVPPDADRFRGALHDAQRELMRARAASLVNLTLGGLDASLSALGVLTIGIGVAQLAIPRAGWASSASGNKLVVPVPLTGSGIDGAYRVEKRDTTTILQGNGTTGPVANNDSLVVLQYDENGMDRAKFVYPTVAAAATFDWSSSTPLAWVRTDATKITMVRDCRVHSPWKPRFAQVVYPTPLPVPQHLLRLDVGSFWLLDDHAVLLSTYFVWEGDPTQNAIEAYNTDFMFSRGDPADNFLQPHAWYGTSQNSVSPRWTAGYPRVGRNSFSMHWLFIPRDWTATHAGEYTESVPGIFHFNGVYLVQATFALRFGSLRAELLHRSRITDVTQDSSPPSIGTPYIPPEALRGGLPLVGG